MYFTVYIPFRFAEEPQIQCQSDTALYCSMCLSIETELKYICFVFDQSLLICLWLPTFTRYLVVFTTYLWGNDWWFYYYNRSNTFKKYIGNYIPWQPCSDSPVSLRSNRRRLSRTWWLLWWWTPMVLPSSVTSAHPSQPSSSTGPPLQYLSPLGRGAGEENGSLVYILKK